MNVLHWRGQGGAGRAVERVGGQVAACDGKAAWGLHGPHESGGILNGGRSGREDQPRQRHQMGSASNLGWSF